MKNCKGIKKKEKLNKFTKKSYKIQNCVGITLAANRAKDHDQPFTIAIATQNTINYVNLKTLQCFVMCDECLKLG